MRATDPWAVKRRRTSCGTDPSEENRSGSAELRDATRKTTRKKNPHWFDAPPLGPDSGLNLQARKVPISPPSFLLVSHRVTATRRRDCPSKRVGVDSPKIPQELGSLVALSEKLSDLLANGGATIEDRHLALPKGQLESKGPRGRRRTYGLFSWEHDVLDACMGGLGGSFTRGLHLLDDGRFGGGRVGGRDDG